MIKKRNETLHSIILGILMIVIFLIIISLVLSLHIYVLVGLTIGGILAILQIIHINYTINKYIEFKSPIKAQRYTVFNYFIRYLVIGLGIILVYYSWGMEALLGTIVGLLSLKIAIYTSPIVNNHVVKKILKR